MLLKNWGEGPHHPLHFFPSPYRVLSGPWKPWGPWNSLEFEKWPWEPWKPWKPWILFVKLSRVRLSGLENLEFYSSMSFVFFRIFNVSFYCTFPISVDFSGWILAFFNNLIIFNIFYLFWLIPGCIFKIFWGSQIFYEDSV